MLLYLQCVLLVLLQGGQQGADHPQVTVKGGEVEGCGAGGGA